MKDETFDYIHWENAAFIEKLYLEYKKNPELVDISWRRFFEGMSFVSKNLINYSENTSENIDVRVELLRDSYRRHGHRMVCCDPLEEKIPLQIPELQIETHYFSLQDLDKDFPTLGLLDKPKAKLSEIIAILKEKYARNIGYEFMHASKDIADFIAHRIEKSSPEKLSKEKKIELLHHLNSSEIFESFIHMKYPGQKRFSIEGGETTIPMLLQSMHSCASLGAKSFVLGMAHRGRLNILANVFKKSYGEIFKEFEPSYMPNTFEGSGDVKYHKGMQTTYSIGEFELELYLAANPSHLESVDPVIEGVVRAKQAKGGSRQTIVPILIHGDASIAGQGIVYETLQLSRLNGYETGGTIHLVINNQIGFTAHPSEARSTNYCTDISYTFGSPVFHVNAEDPENCLWVAKLCAEIRQKFNCDVFMDLQCYRKYGHNESDEFAFTQPKSYQKIKSKKIIRHIYRDLLLQEGSIDNQEAQKLEDDFRLHLNQVLDEMKKTLLAKELKGSSLSKENEMEFLIESRETAVPLAKLKDLVALFTQLPEAFTAHPKIIRLLEERRKAMHSEEARIDWGLSEHLAYASLLSEGISVRISGQDSQRGTFSHRHAAIVDQVTYKKYIPLSQIHQEKATFEVYNSCLSEFAVLGFEFGYSLFANRSLVIWEAQFGDFANGAQTIIDQYIVSSQQKWGQKSSLTLFLPHGYEGQGPEHSSARIERFLQLAAESNIQVIYPTTPAQLFHALRRQAVHSINKPLVVFMPKGLLRYTPSLSRPEEFSKGIFQHVITDSVVDPNEIERVLLCSGRVYYDLIEERERKGGFRVAIVRIEQLYPLNKALIQQNLSHYTKLKEVFWVQEEHSNMGAWNYIKDEIRGLLPHNVLFCYVGRARSASTAAGSMTLHQKQRDIFLNEAFAPNRPNRKSYED